jgi:hypothetical protein
VKKSTSIIILLTTVIIISILRIYVFPPQNSAARFSIILTKDDTKILSGDDIDSYNMSSHELILTEECADRLRKMKEPLTGDFIITIDGEEVLRGIFVPPVVSRSYPSTEVVIVYPSFQSDYQTMKIQMGYPWDEPTEYDPRNNNMMMQYFDLLGKLTQ